MKISEFQGMYRFLSNFYPVQIKYKGIVFPSTEHAFMAMKTLDEDTRWHIASLRTSSEAKRYGRSIKLRPDWEAIKFQVMLEVNRLKYQIPELREMLLATGDAILEEGNTWNDRIWGICPPNSGNGQNHLGRILMKIRAELGGVPYSEDAAEIVTPSVSNQETRQLLLNLAYSVVDKRR